MKKKQTCKAKGCKRRAIYVVHQLCPAHYQRLRLGIPLTGKIRGYEKVRVR